MVFSTALCVGSCNGSEYVLFLIKCFTLILPLLSQSGKDVRPNIGSVSFGKSWATKRYNLHRLCIRKPWCSNKILHSDLKTGLGIKLFRYSKLYVTLNIRFDFPFTPN